MLSSSRCPFTTMLPCWIGSRRLMQRISVDLPEPEGPQSTIFSPLRTMRSTLRRAWYPPYHFCTPFISIRILSCMDSAPLSDGGRRESCVGRSQWVLDCEGNAGDRVREDRHGRLHPLGVEAGQLAV